MEWPEINEDGSFVNPNAQSPIPKQPGSVYEQVSLGGEGIFSPSTWGIVAKNSSGPISLVKNIGQAIGADYTNDLSRRVYWRYNHPLAITNEIGRAIGRSAGYGKVYEQARTGGSRTLPPGVYDTPATALYGIGLVTALDVLSGNVNLGNIADGGRPVGFQAVLPSDQDPRETTNPILEGVSRYVLGRTGRLLPWELFKEERPDIDYEQYTHYQNYLKGHNAGLLGLENIPTAAGIPGGAIAGAAIARLAGGKLSKGATVGAIAGGLLTGDGAKFISDQGIVKGTLDGIDGPEIRAIGYRVPFTAIAGTAAVGVLAHHFGRRIKEGLPIGLPRPPANANANQNPNPGFVANADRGRTIPLAPDRHPGSG